MILTNFKHIIWASPLSEIRWAASSASFSASISTSPLWLRLETLKTLCNVQMKYHLRTTIDVHMMNGRAIGPGRLGKRQVGKLAADKIIHHLEKLNRALLRT
jgi:hypothetical protein